ncbi:MAG: glycosyltransferase family 4 protein [Clostridiales bacterium]|nr:glycosyltransferase family 4 protein [Clostridiales bacterium]
MIRYRDRLTKDDRRTILALSWRDIKSPTSGGAEVHTHEMLSRANHEKYRIIHLAPLYEGMDEGEYIDGINYIRQGNVFTVIWYAFLYYKRNRAKIDYVIDQCNTHRFFTPFWVKRAKRIFYIHQLTREIWDIAMWFPMNKIGKAAENMLLRINKKDYTITVSESTKQDLISVGFDANKIFIVPNGVSFAPWKPEEFKEKESAPTYIYAGRYAAYKGIDVAVEAFGRLKKERPDAKLWILGKKNEVYISQHLLPICARYGLSWGDAGENADVIGWGFVSEQKKLELLSKATALLFPSMREGWGIPITEAANVGTPSIVFDSPGIRDAVDLGKAGYLCRQNDVDGLLEQMLLAANHEKAYQDMRIAAYDFSKQFQWEKTGTKFEEVLEKVQCKAY